MFQVVELLNVLQRLPGAAVVECPALSIPRDDEDDLVVVRDGQLAVQVVKKTKGLAEIIELAPIEEPAPVDPPVLDPQQDPPAL